jgi:hypothetical protein
VCVCVCVCVLTRDQVECLERWRFCRLFHWQLDSKQGDKVWNEIRAHLADDLRERGGRVKAAPIEIVAQSVLDAVTRFTTQLPVMSIVGAMRARAISRPSLVRMLKRFGLCG